MTPQELVQCIRRQVLQTNLAFYESVLDAAAPERAGDRTWQKIGAVYDTMDATQKVSVQIAVRQVMVDTIAILLGILDGVALLEDCAGEFTLMFGDNRQALNGTLQDRFLVEET